MIHKGPEALNPLCSGQFRTSYLAYKINPYLHPKLNEKYGSIVYPYNQVRITEKC